MRRNEGVGRAEILRAKTLVPLTALGLRRSTRPHSVRGAPPRHAQPLRYPGAGRAPWKTGRSLNTVPFFRRFVLDICISRYGKLPLKAAGVCAHWTGSGAKGEPGPREGRGREGIASDGHSAGAKGGV